MSRSPRARRARLNSSDKGGQHHHGHDAPPTLSPRAPPQALGRPPKALTPCWFPHAFPIKEQFRASPLDDLKRRRVQSLIFNAASANGGSGTTSGGGGGRGGNDHPRNHHNNNNNNKDLLKIKNAKKFNIFLSQSRMPIKGILPLLQKLPRSEIIQRVSGAKNFTMLMERFQAKALSAKYTGGDGARSLIDPSSHAWGDKSPRFVRTKMKSQHLSTLSYRASPMGKIFFIFFFNIFCLIVLKSIGHSIFDTYLLFIYYFFYFFSLK